MNPNEEPVSDIACGIIILLSVLGILVTLVLWWSKYA